ncbi:hypothetical protein BD324DRAFT_617288 [Kockovaella imperatae]|uniref:catechol O-methyltransferase n=1 Tax=Kockovaella imperatae TaxID=4999 RepID=A0A1Y1URS4_9TREE|nr:hypothetical protein BD324DRAFT_617288 [Kockovaella imperatae]ORX40317.1 hypothetical protein BD324DRAFT_617288 [Kockovaella imperatae]
MTTAPPKYHEPVQGTIFHGDGREEALQKHLLQLPALQSDATKHLSLFDRSQRVLDAIHEFGKGANRYLMSVGDTKGKQVEELIAKRKPKLILEVGTYVGYSGISFSRQLLEAHPDATYPADWSSSGSSSNRAGYICLEKSEVYASTAQTAFELAGVVKAIKVLVGGSSSSIKSLRDALGLSKGQALDMIFLDHVKFLYSTDIKLLESEGLIDIGTVIVADNVVKPGNPAYLSWVRATPAQKKASLNKPALTEQPETTPNPPSSEWSTAFRDGPLDETRWAFPEAEGYSAPGDPSLVYKSSMLGGWDPYTQEEDACEVSECVGRE